MPSRADFLSWLLLGGGAGVSVGPMGTEIVQSAVPAAADAADAFAGAGASVGAGAAPAASAAAAAGADALQQGAVGPDEIVEIDAGLLAAETLLATMVVAEAGGGLDMSASPDEDTPKNLDQTMEFAKYNLGGAIAGSPMEESKAATSTTTPDSQREQDAEGAGGLANVGQEFGAWWWEYLARGLVPRSDFVNALNVRNALKIAMMGLAYVDTDFNLLAPLGVGFVAESLLREYSAGRTRNAVPRRMYFDGGAVYEGPLVAGAPQGVGLYSNCGITAPRARLVAGRAALGGLALLLRSAELRYVGEWVRGVPDGLGAGQGGQDVSFVWASIAASTGGRGIEDVIANASGAKQQQNASEQGGLLDSAGEGNAEAGDTEPMYYVRGLYDGRWRLGQPSRGVCTLARFPGAGPMGESLSPQTPAAAGAGAGADGDSSAGAGAGAAERADSETSTLPSRLPYVQAVLAGDFVDGVFRSGVITVMPTPSDDATGGPRSSNAPSAESEQPQPQGPSFARGATIDEYHVALLDPLPASRAPLDKARDFLREAARVGKAGVAGLDRASALALARSRALGAHVRKDAATGEVISTYVGEFTGLQYQGFGALAATAGGSMDDVKAWLEEGSGSDSESSRRVATTAAVGTNAVADVDTAELRDAGLLSEPEARASVALAEAFEGTDSPVPAAAAATVRAGRFQDDELQGSASRTDVASTVMSALQRAEAATNAAQAAREESGAAAAYARARERVAELNL